MLVYYFYDSYEFGHKYFASNCQKICKRTNSWFYSFLYKKLEESVDTFFLFAFHKILRPVCTDVCTDEVIDRALHLRQSICYFSFFNDCLQTVGNNTKRPISKWELQENKARQIFRKTNKWYPILVIPVLRFTLLPCYRRKFTLSSLKCFISFECFLSLKITSATKLVFVIK